MMRPLERKASISSLSPLDLYFFQRENKVKDKHLRLGDMDRLAAHQTPMNDKQQRDGVEFEWGTSEPGAEGKALVDPAVRNPIGHEAVESERRRDRGALKVLRLSGSVLGDVRGRHVEAGQARETTKDEEGQE